MRFERPFCRNMSKRRRGSPTRPASSGCVAEVYIHGPDARRQVVSVETSTPKARAFVDALLGSADFRGADIR